MSSKRKVVFLDRDGTLIEDKIYLNNPQDIVYLPGCFEALRRLRDHGFEFIVVTNQSGVARGIVDVSNLKEIHRLIRNEFSVRGVDILDFYYAPFLPVTDHYFRKPKPGMLLEGAFDYNVDLSQSWMVGDRMTDVEAGHRAGCRSIFMGQTEDPGESPYSSPEAIVEGISDVADYIIQENNGFSETGAI